MTARRLRIYFGRPQWLWRYAAARLAICRGRAPKVIAMSGSDPITAQTIQVAYDCSPAFQAAIDAGVRWPIEVQDRRAG